MVRLAVALNRPVHEVLAYDPQLFTTLVEEVFTDGKSKESGHVSTRFTAIHA